ncbi:MAG TPA: DUF748 domain-containing protein [Thermoanaerobaculia bacterium]|nr:DUF748 domain-containing protein [Thermoanaerobaculia bacterium]
MSRARPEAPPPSRSRARKSGLRTALLAVPRAVRWVLAAILVLLIVLVVASFFVDAPMRRHMEAKMNESLKGYSVRLPGLHFQLVGMSVTLHGLTVRQNAHPETPVLTIPTLHASVEWRELLTGHVVADFRLDQPRIHVDLPQLRAEVKGPLPAREEGWQQAVEAIYPLKINLLRINDADVVYVDEDPGRPLHIAHLNARAENIRNIHSRAHVYPSPFHAEAVIFDRGRAVLDGHADFLSEPFPGVHTTYDIRDVPIDRFRPIVERSNIVVKGGTLSSSGEIEYAPKTELVDVHDLLLQGLKLDVVHSTATAGNEHSKKAAVEKAASNVTNKPAVLLRMQKLRIRDGEIGLVNKAHNPPYRAFLSNTNVDVSNLSNHFSQGPAKATLTGRFMGSGASHATAAFRPEDAGPDFDLIAAIEHTDMTAMNDILRAYGKFDVAKGDFSFYSELHVRKGALTGYMKPLFADLKIGAPGEKKSLGKKVYEAVVSGVSKILENRKKKDVATVVDLSGRIDNPRESVWQIIGKAIENAFIRAILPGFDREVASLRR